MTNEALEVSNAGGWLLTREYVNALRKILGYEPMTEAEYAAATGECVQAGRDAVARAHYEQLGKMGWFEFIKNAP